MNFVTHNPAEIAGFGKSAWLNRVLRFVGRKSGKREKGRYSVRKTRNHNFHPRPRRRVLI